MKDRWWCKHFIFSHIHCEECEKEHKAEQEQTKQVQMKRNDFIGKELNLKELIIELQKYIDEY